MVPCFVGPVACKTHSHDASIQTENVRPERTHTSKPCKKTFKQILRPLKVVKAFLHFYWDAVSDSRLISQRRASSEKKGTKFTLFQRNFLTYEVDLSLQKKSN